MSSLPDFNKPVSVQAECSRQPTWELSVVGASVLLLLQLKQLLAEELKTGQMVLGSAKLIERLN